MINQSPDLHCKPELFGNTYGIAKENQEKKRIL
jgi:hypothetical protein